MKNNQRGITLIALIITIVVLLILAAVTITVVTNEDIIFKAKEATKMHQVKEDEQEIELDLNEWAILKYSQQSANFEGFLKDKYGNAEKVSEGTYKVTTENGNEFTVTETGATYVGTTDGEIENPDVPTNPSTPAEPVKPTITLSTSTITGEIKKGATEAEAVGTITATVSVEGTELVWTVTPANSGITLEGTGNTRTVKVSKAVEGATITVSVKDDSSIKKECSVNVTEKKSTMITVNIPYVGNVSVPEGSTWQYLFDNFLIPTERYQEIGFLYYFDMSGCVWLLEYNDYEGSNYQQGVFSCHNSCSSLCDCDDKERVYLTTVVDTGANIYIWGLV